MSMARFQRRPEPTDAAKLDQTVATPRLGPDHDGVQSQLRAGVAPAKLLHALQRTVGNQAVQRMLHAQRAPDAQPPTAEARAFVPEMLTDPQDASLMIGEQRSVGVRVTNAKRAPAGAKLSWLHPTTVQSGAGPPVEVISTKSANHSRMQALKLRGQAPGKATFTPELLHQAPGEEEERTPGPTAVIQVPEPLIVFAGSTVVPADGGAVVGENRLHVGDELLVRFEQIGVKGHEGNDPLASNGARADFKVSQNGPRTLSAREAEWVSPHVFQVRTRAIAVGSTDADIFLTFGKQPFAQQPATTIAPHVEMGAQDFLNACGETNTLIDAADRRATAWLASVANAYAKAWKTHTDTLKDQADFERLVGDLILGAALAFVPGGAAGLIATKMTGLLKGNGMVIDGVKTLGKWGIEKGVGHLESQATEASSTGLTAYPTDPSQWQNQEVVRIQSELAKVTEQLKGWQAKARAGDPGLFLDFDPVKAMEAALTVSDSSGDQLKAADLVPVNVQTLSDQFEKGFWKSWLEQYGTRVLTSLGMFGWETHSVIENAGSKIRDRCEALGLPIDTYVEVSRRQKEKEAAELRDKQDKEFRKKWFGQR